MIFVDLHTFLQKKIVCCFAIFMKNATCYHYLMFMCQNTSHMRNMLFHFVAIGAGKSYKNTSVELEIRTPPIKILEKFQENLRL